MHFVTHRRPPSKSLQPYCSDLTLYISRLTASSNYRSTQARNKQTNAPVVKGRNWRRNGVPTLGPRGKFSGGGDDASAAPVLLFLFCTCSSASKTRLGNYTFPEGKGQFVFLIQLTKMHVGCGLMYLEGKETEVNFRRGESTASVPVRRSRPSPPRPSRVREELNYRTAQT